MNSSKNNRCLLCLNSVFQFLFFDHDCISQGFPEKQKLCVCVCVCVERGGGFILRN